jgi:hypothetical protein
MGFKPNQDPEERTRKPLTEDDAAAILEHTNTVEDVSLVAFPDCGFNRTITHQGYTYRRSNLSGVSANYAQTTNVAVGDGRFISDFDD